jgi:hypothetical protein
MKKIIGAELGGQFRIAALPSMHSALIKKLLTK